MQAKQWRKQVQGQFFRLHFFFLLTMLTVESAKSAVANDAEQRIPEVDERTRELIQAKMEI